jgi:hypothetical protein
MKKYIIAPLIAGTAFFSFTCVAQDSGKEFLYLSKPLAAEAITAVEAETSGGGIEISGGYNQDARLEVYATPNGILRTFSKANIEERLREKYDFSVTVTDHKLTVINNSGGHIDLEIPKGKGFDLKLNGKIKTEGLNSFSGTTEEESMRGSVNGGGTTVNVDAGGGRILLSFT